MFWTVKNRRVLLGNALFTVDEPIFEQLTDFFDVNGEFPNTSLIVDDQIVVKITFVTN